MRDVWPIALKAGAGGAFVVLFALIGEAVHPKHFAGLFAAAPSVAIGSLLISALTKEPLTRRYSRSACCSGVSGWSPSAWSAL